MDHTKPEISEGIKPRRKFRRTINAIPTTFTIGNLFCGFYSIVSVQHGNFDMAAILIGWAAVFDVLDGRIARLTKTSSEMGLQLDSLADVISFCLAPAILINAWAFPQHQPIGWIISFIYIICGAMRLARFNIMGPGHKDFVGMPTPAAGGMIASLVYYFQDPKLVQDYYLGILALVGLLAFLMISTIRYVGLKGSEGKNHSYRTILLLTLLITGIYFYSRIVLVSLASIYTLSGICFKLFSILSRHLGHKNIPKPTLSPKS